MKGKICGRCCYAIFAPLHCCLAPLPSGHKYRSVGIDKTKECVVPNWYTENTRSQAKRAAFIQKAQDALTAKGDEDAE